VHQLFNIIVVIEGYYHNRNAKKNKIKMSLDLLPKRNMSVPVCSVTKKKSDTNFVCFNINKSVMLLSIMHDTDSMYEEPNIAL
jgi:hypothetical protein